MGAVIKSQLRQQFWGLIETTVDGYENTIDLLITAMSEEQLRGVLSEMRSNTADQNPD